MLYDYPLTLGQINNKLGEDCYQLLTIDGNDFEQLKGLTKISNKLMETYDIDFYISSNPHDFGTYYGLEVSDTNLRKYPDLEEFSIIIAEELGYDI